MKHRKSRVPGAAVGTAVLLQLFLLPLGAEAADILAVERAGEDRLYAITKDGGVLFSENGGKDWEHRNRGLPLKRVWPFSKDEYRGIRDIAADEEEEKRALLTTSTGIYLTENEGRDWKRVPLRSPVNSSNYLTSVSFDPNNKNRIYLGTSFKGLFVSEDNGDSWRELEDLLSPLYRGAGFYKEISDICVCKDGEAVYILNSFDRTLYKFEPEEGIVEEVQIPKEYDSFEIEGMSRYSGGAVEGPAVELHSSTSRIVYGLEDELWRELPPLLFKNEANDNDTDHGRYRDKRGVYLNSYNSYGRRLEEHLEFIKRHGFNSIVVDVKDDTGRISHKTELERPRRYGAVLGAYDLEELVAKAHEEEVYVIARIVVFKDDVLYKADNHSFAVWNTHRDGPWGHFVEQKDPDTGEEKRVQREYWVDPFSEEVWDYNIAVAEEAQQKGVDEIQFDYIRFPSDGDVNRIHYRHRKREMTKTDALESFLRKARGSIDIPISADLYGFNSWYRMGNWIGQDMEIISEYVDVICPMYYPSHFPSKFMSDGEYLERAYRLYLEGTERAAEITGGKSVIRPYVQAFLLGGELSMEESRYEEYLNRQIEGTLEGGGSGYTLWNNMNRYYMVNSVVNELNEMDTEEEEQEKGNF
ncbi:MAG: putative glycoside hydrolase [Spirochaetaceae bacterium]